MINRPERISYHNYIYCILDDFGKEVIYSQESPKMEESFKDFNWDLKTIYFVFYIAYSIYFVSYNI